MWSRETISKSGCKVKNVTNWHGSLALQRCSDSYALAFAVDTRFPTFSYQYGNIYAFLERKKKHTSTSWPTEVAQSLLCNQVVNVHTMLTTASLSHVSVNAISLPYRRIRLLELSRFLSWSAGYLDLATARGSCF